MGFWHSLKLKSRSATARCKAIDKLGESGDPTALAALVEACSDEETTIRKRAYAALGKVEVPGAIDALMAGLEDPSGDVREAAACSLGKSGDARAVSALIERLLDHRDAVRTAAAVALKELGWKPGNAEDQALFEVALGNPRSAAFAGQEAVPALVAELKNDTTSFRRRAAAEALEDVNDTRSIEPLIAATQDPDATVRVSAIHALGKQESCKIRGMLRILMRDPDGCVRLAAVQVLAKQLDPALEPEFVRLLNDSQFEVRLTAVQFLGKIQNPALLKYLVPMLSDKDSDVRQAAAQALGNLRSKAAIEELVMALTDEEKLVREAAEAALEQISPYWAFSGAAQNAKTRLEQKLGTSPAWVRSAIVQVLAKMEAPLAAVQPGVPVTTLHLAP